MLSPGKAVGLLLAVSLAGCVSVPPGERARVPDWASPEMASIPPVSRPAEKQLSPGLPANALEAPPKAAPLSHSPEARRPDTWMPLYRWCNNHGLPAPARIGDSANFELRSPGGTLEVSAWSQRARWQGVDLHLGFSPQIINGDLYVNGLDLQKTVEPLLTPATTLPLSRRLVVIDPGHGGTDAGARSTLGQRPEKDLTLDWAKRLEQLLSGRGWTVVLTRTNDADLAISNRVALADQLNAGLYVSLHFNSAPADSSSRGVETYCMTPAGAPSTVTRGFNDDTDAVYPNNDYDTRNLQAAWRIQRELVRISGVRDRGVRRARFLGVLKTQARPAVLIEGGYLSNTAEAQLVATPAYRQKLAEAVATAVGGFDIGPLASTRKDPAPVPGTTKEDLRTGSGL